MSFVIRAEAPSVHKMREALKHLMPRFVEFNRLIGSLNDQAKSKKLTDDQIKFVQRYFMHDMSPYNMLIRPFMQSMQQLAQGMRGYTNKHIQEGIVDEGRRDWLSKLAEQYPAVLAQIDDMTKKAEEFGFTVHAQDDISKFFPGQTVMQEQPIDDVSSALVAESTIMMDLKQKGDMATMMMEQADALYALLLNKDLQATFTPGMKLKLSAYLDSYRDIDQTIKARDQLVQQLKSDMGEHITKREFFSQATFTKMIKLISYYEMVITFGMSAVQLLSEIGSLTTAASVIFVRSDAGTEIDWTIDAMQELLNLLEAT